MELNYKRRSPAVLTRVGSCMYIIYVINMLSVVNGVDASSRKYKMVQKARVSEDVGFKRDFIQSKEARTIFASSITYITGCWHIVNI